MGALLALGSAVAYGVSDVVGGLAARRLRPPLVALIGQVSGLVAVAIAVAVLPSAAPGPADVAWGALSGIGTGAAMVFLFRGMARGAMSVVVPVSAVGGVALPVVVGVALLGERPSAIAWIGVALVLPSLWLVSRDAPATPAGPALRDGLAAGVGIAVQYLGLAQAGPTAGLWPVLAGRVTAVVAVGVLVAAMARPRTPVHARASAPQRPAAAAPAGAGPAGLAAIAGLLAAVALTAYLLAARSEYVAVAVVLSSIYPVVPVAVGLAVLGERVRRPQVAGLLGALVAAVLVAAG